MVPTIKTYSAAITTHVYSLVKKQERMPTIDAAMYPLCQLKLRSMKEYPNNAKQTADAK